MFLAAVLLIGSLSGATASVVGFGIGSLLTPLVAWELGTNIAVGSAGLLPLTSFAQLSGWHLRRHARSLAYR